MRPLPISVVLSLALRISASNSARRIFPSVEEYRRNFTCAPPLKQFSNLMADLNPKATEEAAKTCEPAEECKISDKPAVKDKAEEEKKVAPAEPALPKLSAADFKAYNHMAENMQYYVSSPLHLNPWPLFQFG